jgi:hypothetical protein
VRVHSSQRSRSAQQLSTPCAINAPLSVRPVEGDAKPGARLVRNCMKCEQRLEHSPVVSLCQILERNPTRSGKTVHSSARRSGTAPRRSSTQALHCLPVCSTRSGQLGKRPGGHSTPTGGDKRNRYASERSRITSVRANISGGHSRSSSVIGRPATTCQVDASVGSSVWKYFEGSSTALLLICFSWSLASAKSRTRPRTGPQPPHPPRS